MDIKTVVEKYEDICTLGILTFSRIEFLIHRVNLMVEQDGQKGENEKVQNIFNDMKENHANGEYAFNNALLMLTQIKLDNEVEASFEEFKTVMELINEYMQSEDYKNEYKRWSKEILDSDISENTESILQFNLNYIKEIFESFREHFLEYSLKLDI